MRDHRRIHSRLAMLALFAIGIPPCLAASLPEDYVRSLRAAGIPASATAVVVEPLDGGSLRVAESRDRPMSPASTMKVVTTYAALRALGPAYKWRTDVILLGDRGGDVVRGDVAFRGGGDPSLVIEELWLLVQQMRAAGIREVRGDIVLDRTAFQLPPHDSSAFDGDALRSYNVGPDALLINYASIAYQFIPDATSGLVRVSTLPSLAGAKLPSTVRASDGACGDWQGKLRADFANPLAPVFRGTFPLVCGDRSWNLSPLEPDAYFDAVFRAMWQASGGVWTGKTRNASAPVGGAAIVVHESLPLAEIIRNINKYSNNVMTQQLYLSFGAERLGWPGNFAQSGVAMRAWLAENSLAMPELVLANGSGLSRDERISAGSLARLLANAFASPVMPELMSSLPLVGVDGTARTRKGAVGAAHIKTGQLKDVRAVAGFVLATSGRRYVVVAIVNHPNAGGAQAAHDALLGWVQRQG